MTTSTLMICAFAITIKQEMRAAIIGKRQNMDFGDILIT
jgi:hypothetical protein